MSTATTTTFTLHGVLVDDRFVTLTLAFGSYDGAVVCDTYGRVIAKGTATEDRFDDATIWAVPDVDPSFAPLIVEVAA